MGAWSAPDAGLLIQEHGAVVALEVLLRNPSFWLGLGGKGLPRNEAGRSPRVAGSRSGGV